MAGSFTQSNTSGINPQSGMPILPPANTMPMGLPPAGNIPYYSQAPQQNNLAVPLGASNSDAFFSSANASTPSRVVSVTPNTASAGAGYNTAALNNLIAAYTKNSEAARNASLKQHDALMSSVTGSMGKVDKYLGQLGATGMTRIAENEANQRGQAEQDAVSRGLGNTTIRSSMQRGVSKDAEQARQQLGESLAQQKIGTTMGLTQMFGNALLSRQNIGPDNSYLALIQQLAASGRA